MRLVLKGKHILELSKAENIHQLSMKAGVSVTTAYKHIDHPETVKNFDTEILLAFLMKGAGLSKKEILDLKIGDLFKIADELKEEKQQPT
jgi:hypothetical protein